MCRVGPGRKTLGSGLNAGNIGAEIDVIKPALPAQTHAPIAIHFAFGVSRISFHRVYDDAGNVIETQEQAGDFKEP